MWETVCGLQKDLVDELVELVELSKRFGRGQKLRGGVKDAVVQTCAMIFAGTSVNQVS